LLPISLPSLLNFPITNRHSGSKCRKSAISKLALRANKRAEGLITLTVYLKVDVNGRGEDVQLLTGKQFGPAIIGWAGRPLDWRIAISSSSVCSHPDHVSHAVPQLLAFSTVNVNVSPGVIHAGDGKTGDVASY
jgi:hypothetical protein